MQLAVRSAIASVITVLAVACGTRVRQDIRPPGFASVEAAVASLGADTTALLFIVNGVILQDRSTLPRPSSVRRVEVVRGTSGHCLAVYQRDGVCPIVIQVESSTSRR
jgi:hypothetical protein